MASLIDLYDLAETNSITVDCFNMKEVLSLSCMTRSGSCYIAIDPMQLETNRDEKARLAHELGHCLTGSFYNKSNLLDVRGKHEARANKWAFKKLIPKNELINAVEAGNTEVWELAEYFDVPEGIMKKAMEFYQYND